MDRNLARLFPDGFHLSLPDYFLVMVLGMLPFWGVGGIKLTIKKIYAIIPYPDKKL
jgi:hypothetical protein